MTNSQMNLLNKLIDTKDLSKKDFKLPITLQEQTNYGVEAASIIIDLMIALPDVKKLNGEEQLLELLKKSQDKMLSNNNKKKLVVKCEMAILKNMSTAKKILTIEDVKKMTGKTERSAFVKKFVA